MNKLIAIIGLFTVAACGSDSTTGPERVKFISTISANSCANGKFSVTTNWQTTAVWRAIFVRAVPVNETVETSLFTNVAKTSACVFNSGDIAYAVLDSNAIGSDNDISPLITVK